MYGERDATMTVLTETPVDQAVINALESAASALGHATGCSVVPLAEAPDLAAFVLEADPWAVVGIDGASIERMRLAFGEDSARLAPDAPVRTWDGCVLVAVPGFAACLDEPEAKRVAWNRLKAARHPANPLG